MHPYTYDALYSFMNTICRQYFDRHESKLAICILAIIEESQIASIISYFATYSFHDQT